MADTITPTDISKDLRNDADKNKAQAKVLSRPNDTEDAKAAQDQRDAQIKHDQQKSLDNAAKEAADRKSALLNRAPRSNDERAVDTVRRYLAIYKDSQVGSAAKLEALQKIIATISRFPKKSILDEILQFFRDHREDEWLEPMQALQGTLSTDRSTNIKIRTFYMFMSELASGRASRKTISLDVIRNIFGSDELVNWVALKLSHSGR